MTITVHGKYEQIQLSTRFSLRVQRFRALQLRRGKAPIVSNTFKAHLKAFYPDEYAARFRKKG